MGTAGHNGKGGGLTLRRLHVWLAEPTVRLRGLAGVADAVAGLRGGALINAVHALAQHGDVMVQQFAARALEQMCQPLFQMIRQWVFDGKLDGTSGDFFVVATGMRR